MRRFEDEERKAYEALKDKILMIKKCDNLEFSSTQA